MLRLVVLRHLGPQAPGLREEKKGRIQYNHVECFSAMKFSMVVGRPLVGTVWCKLRGGGEGSNFFRVVGALGPFLDPPPTLNTGVPASAENQAQETAQTCDIMPKIFCALMSQP